MAGYSKSVGPGYSWIEELVYVNPQGVMQVLSRNGYSGFLAPQDQDELLDAAYDFVELRGEEAVVELVKVHPLYDIFVGLSQEGKAFRNAGGPVQSFIANINFREAARSVLMVIGIVFLAGQFLNLFKDE